MKRLVRAESRRRRPSAIKEHTWTASEIREKPEEAFALFDYRKDGQISVAELLFTVRKTNPGIRQRGSIFDEMKLFELLDVDGDAVISKREFCAVVSDPSLFSDEALAAIAKMATRRAEEAAKQEGPPIAPKDEVDADAMEYEAIAATTGLVHGKQVSLRRSKSLRTEVETSMPTLDDDCEVLVELYAIGLPAMIRSWYDIFKLSSPSTADPYVIIRGSKFGERVILGQTSILYETLVGAWDPVLLRHNELKSLDEPFRVTFDLWDAGANVKLGSTTPVDLGTPHTVPFDHAQEVAIGPLPVLNPDDHVNGKILGMRKWMKRQQRAPRPPKTPDSWSALCTFAFCAHDDGACPAICYDHKEDQKRIEDSPKQKLDFLFQADTVRARSTSPPSRRQQPKKSGLPPSGKSTSNNGDNKKVREIRI